MRIFLIGYMGSGKSTFGKKLANKLGYEFIDLDHRIESQSGKSINEIFESEGENGFRSLESKVLHQQAELNRVVISVGGGTPCFNNNMKTMLESGLTIYLELTPKSLFDRLKNAKAKRPIIKDKTDDQLLAFIEQHLNERIPFYSQAKLHVNGLSISKNTMDNLIQTIAKEAADFHS